jgi:hypothetical protein
MQMIGQADDRFDCERVTCPCLEQVSVARGAADEDSSFLLLTWALKFAS